MAALNAGKTVIDYVKNGTTIRVYNVGREVTVFSNGVEILTTRNALLLEEKGCKPVYYFPRKDVADGVLVPTEHRTVCQYKGNANYYDLSVGGKVFENSVWQYSDSYDDFTVLRDYVAFYDSAVERIEFS